MAMRHSMVSLIQTTMTESPRDPNRLEGQIEVTMSHLQAPTKPEEWTKSGGVGMGSASKKLSFVYYNY